MLTEWNRPLSWEELEDDELLPMRKCGHCEDKQAKLDNAAHFLEAVVDILYSKEEFQALRLERCLDELCSYLDVKLVEGDLQVERLRRK